MATNVEQKRSRRERAREREFRAHERENDIHTERKRASE